MLVGPGLCVHWQVWERVSGAKQRPTAGAAGPAAVGGAESSAGGDHPQTGPVHHRGHGEGTDPVRGRACKSGGKPVNQHNKQGELFVVNQQFV